MGLELSDIESNRKDTFFGTEPEIFILNHFPKESKWQLLENPYTLEKFDSLPFFYPPFFLFDIKNISPYTKKLSGSGKITFTYEKSEISGIIDIISYLDTSHDMTYNKVTLSNGNAEIEYNIDNKNKIVTIVSLKFKNQDFFIPIFFYLSDYSKESSLNLRRMMASNFKIKNSNDLAGKAFQKLNIFEDKK